MPVYPVIAFTLLVVIFFAWTAFKLSKRFKIYLDPNSDEATALKAVFDRLPNETQLRVRSFAQEKDGTVLKAPSKR